MPFNYVPECGDHSTDEDDEIGCEPSYRPQPVMWKFAETSQKNLPRVTVTDEQQTCRPVPASRSPSMGTTWTRPQTKLERTHRRLPSLGEFRMEPGSPVIDTIKTDARPQRTRSPRVSPNDYQNVRTHLSHGNIPLVRREEESPVIVEEETKPVSMPTRAKARAGRGLRKKYQELRQTVVFTPNQFSLVNMLISPPQTTHRDEDSLSCPSSPPPGSATNASLQTLQVSSTTLGKMTGDPLTINCCEMCQTLFSFTQRKHRCKNCGCFCCRECSNQKMKVPHKGYNKKRRVCDRCFTKLSELEMISQDNYLKQYRTLGNSYKLVFLGPSRAGKTSFVQKTARGYLPSEDELRSMLGVSMLPFDLSYQLPRSQDPVTIPFHVWDINGSERYFALLDSYCSHLDVCVLVFDLSGDVST